MLKFLPAVIFDVHQSTSTNSTVPLVKSNHKLQDNSPFYV